jgi:short-subunit dehydrogenase
MRLAGATALLTGANGGIGIEVLVQLLARGASVVATTRNAAALGDLAPVAAAIRRGQLLAVEGDLTDAEFRASLVERVREWGAGRLSLLVNAAGAADFSLLEHQEARDIERLVALNLVAPIDLTRLALPLLQAAPEAAIVNLGSVYGAIGYPGNAVYSATKFGLRGFSEALRRELADGNVRVLHVAPRAVRTPLNTPAVDELNRSLGNAVDEPAQVAAQLVRALQRTRGNTTLGWPERLFVRVNAVAPGIVDGAIGSKLPLIKTQARRNKGRELQ